MSGYTPMMRQYLEIKNSYPDAILFFRLGDFYEMFLEDAEKASRVLEITLTARDGGSAGKIPMCGIPYHAADTYIARLIERGYKVAICEQVEDPKATKGIVRREVIRVITPGTLLDTNFLDEKKNNYLVAVFRDDLGYGLAVVDVSTGYFGVTEITGFRALSRLRDEIARLQPVECLVPAGLEENKEVMAVLKSGSVMSVSPYEDKEFGYDRACRSLLEHFGTNSLAGFGCEKMHIGIQAAGAIIRFLQNTQKNSLVHINKLAPYTTEHYMLLDAATRRNLEITRTIRGGSRRGTLLSVLDYTVTAMGGRLLKTWLEQPLVDAREIQRRLDAVEELVKNIFLRSDLRKYLQQVYDLERLAGRIAYGTVNGRELVALKNSLKVLPAVKDLLVEAYSPGLEEIARRLDNLEDVAGLIEKAIADDPPLSVRDGGIIKTGYHPEVDRLRSASTDGKNWIAGLEAREKERTGIKSLKVGFNKVFGYYIEVTNANAASVPIDYTRKQTLANAERYITPELKEFEALVLGAEEKICGLEYQLFSQIRDEIAAHIERLQATAGSLAALDVYLSLAEAALKNRYVKPCINEQDVLDIKEGRHPVVEQTLQNGAFVPNDCYLDGDGYRLGLITGPNMAGKSTYMRQVALIVLMAQVGSFVPAEAATVGVADRIFTRVGASDDLATGQSTFMVEMNEVANILNNATQKSLIILDEIGRGTSTFDGLSIAWAVTEYILDPDRIGAKTLFATHYHELTELADLFSGVQNFSIAVREKGDDIIFLRKIIPGGADRSYGIQVARLAGLPTEVLARAKEILHTLEAQEELAKGKRETAAARLRVARPDADQLSFFVEPGNSHPVLEELKRLDIMNLTPLEALARLHEMQQSLKNEEDS